MYALTHDVGRRGGRLLHHLLRRRLLSENRVGTYIYTYKSIYLSIYQTIYSISGEVPRAQPPLPKELPVALHTPPALARTDLYNTENTDKIRGWWNYRLHNRRCQGRCRRRRVFRLGLRRRCWRGIRLRFQVSGFIYLSIYLCRVSSIYLSIHLSPSAGRCRGRRILRLHLRRRCRRGVHLTFWGFGFRFRLSGFGSGI